MTVKKKPQAGGSEGVYTHELEYLLREELDLADITAGVAAAVTKSGFNSGSATVFVPGATGAVTCLEYEPGVIADFKDALERIAPRSMQYEHNRFQADGNGHSHVRAGLLGPSLAIPFVDGQLTLGVWQQVTLVNFDNRSRRRRVIVQVIGA